MPSKGTSVPGRPRKDGSSHSSSGDVLEVPNNDAKLTANMTDILNVLIHDNIKQKRDAVTDASSRLQREVDEIARRYEDNKFQINGLQDKLKKTTDDSEKTRLRTEIKSVQKLQSKNRAAVQSASQKFKGEVAEIKAYLEGKGFKDLDRKIYTSDQVNAIVESINKGH